MRSLSNSTVRKKVIPLTAIVAVLFVIVLSLNAFVQSSNDAFAFQAYWPRPTAYLPNNPLPSAYLQINYTGVGTLYYNYTVTGDSGVLAHGDVGVSHRSPLTIYLIAPTPNVLNALVFSKGHLVFNQTLTLG